MSEVAIDWTKLDQPILFFGLTDDFILDDLKKVYKSYIKKFKPDLFPEEFKKIRHAYETLLDRLEFNEYEKTLEKLDEKKHGNLNAKSNSSSDLDTPENFGENSIDPTEEYSFQDIYSVQIWLEKMALSPRTCLQWAAFSDIVKSEENHFYWLIKGTQFLDIKDYYYGGFLSQFVRSCQAEVDWFKSLTELASGIKINIFYHYLYPVFNQMMKDLDPEKVIDCLVNCEKKLIYVGDYIEYKQEMYLMLLGKTILTEKPELYTPMIEFLQSYKTRLTDEQYNTLEFFINLIEYLKLYNSNQNKNAELINIFHSLIVFYIVNDEEKCRQIIFEIKVYFKDKIEFDSSFFTNEFNTYSLSLYRVIFAILEDLDHLLIFKEYNQKIKVKNANDFNDTVSNSYHNSFLSLFVMPFASFFIKFGAIFISFIFLIFSFVHTEFFISAVFAIMVPYLIYNQKIHAFESKISGILDNHIYKKLLKKLFIWIFKKEILIEHFLLLPHIHKNPDKIIHAKIIFEKIEKEKFFLVHELFARLK